jgi:hypothetical protein
MKILLLTLLLAVPVIAQDLHKVNKIFIGDMGTSDEAERFKMLLDDSLSKKGFTVVDKEEKADAVMTGVLSVRDHAKSSEARVTIFLKDKDGNKLWSMNFGSHRTWLRKDPVEARADDVASKLRDDWKKEK